LRDNFQPPNGRREGDIPKVGKWVVKIVEMLSPSPKLRADIGLVVSHGVEPPPAAGRVESIFVV
jgi:hypothetical protein